MLQGNLLDSERSNELRIDFMKTYVFYYNFCICHRFSEQLECSTCIVRVVSSNDYDSNINIISSLNMALDHIWLHTISDQNRFSYALI